MKPPSRDPALDRFTDDGAPPRPSPAIEETPELEEDYNVWEDLGQRLDLRERMEAHPIETILLAAGVGFVASGALVSRFSSRLFAVAFRVALFPLLERRIAQVLRRHDD